MTLAAVIAAVSVVFPPDGAKMPALSRCYVMGSTDGGEGELVATSLSSGVSSPAPVSRTGAWSTVVGVRPGTNVVEIGGVRRAFTVGAAETSGTGVTSRVYKKLEYAGDRAKPHPTGKSPSEVTVVLDPGHGGIDTGALSPHGLAEKDANLRLAKAVRAELAKRGFRVVMTREDDSFPALYDRPKVAHREGADAFVSIHHNAPGYGTDPAKCRDQSVYAWNPLGERLARAINRRMAAAVPTLRNLGVLHANFAVTRNPEIPSCLVEADYVTSPEGEADVWDPARRERQAAAIAEGVLDWLRSSEDAGSAR